MSYENKPNSGALFPNEKTKETQPDYKGHFFDANLKKWDVAAWEKTSKSNKRYLSLSIQEPRTEQQEQPPVAKSDLPF